MAVALRPSAVVGWATRSKAGLARTALADTFSMEHPGVDLTASGLQLVEIEQAAVAAEVVGRVDHGLDPQRPPVFEVLLDP